MLNKSKLIELIISTELIIISIMIQTYIAIPNRNDILSIIEIPISLQVPTIIFLAVVLSRNIIIKSFTIYLLIGLFLLPVFYDGGSIGYLLTPNFGYLLGMYPLIINLNKLRKINNLSSYKFLKQSIKGIFLMHIIGVIYTIILFAIFNQFDSIFYSIAKYTISKIPYELLMLFPIATILFLFKKIKFS